MTNQDKGFESFLKTAIIPELEEIDKGRSKLLRNGKRNKAAAAIFVILILFMYYAEIYDAAETMFQVNIIFGIFLTACFALRVFV